MWYTVYNVYLSLIFRWINYFNNNWNRHLEKFNIYKILFKNPSRLISKWITGSCHWSWSSIGIFLFSQREKSQKMASLRVVWDPKETSTSEEREENEGIFGWLSRGSAFGASGLHHRQRWWCGQSLDIVMAVLLLFAFKAD